jgi:hypothetical protein
MSVVVPSSTVRDLDRRRVRDLIRRVSDIDDPGARVAAAGGLFLGAPYQSNPLDGSPTGPEEITVALDGFDCVTYVEYALALGVSETPDDFVDHVRAIRYSGGIVEWNTRNHYMTAWIRSNVRAGYLRDRTQGRGLVERRRQLDVVPGLKAREVRVRSIQKRELMRRLPEVCSGDLAFFASTRRHIDVFHCGILVVDTSEGVVLRHATQSRGRVVDQSLSSFLTANRMSGVLLVRPIAK